MSAHMADYEMPDTMEMRLSHLPPVNSGEFRDAMANVGSSVSIVSARRGEERVGRTVTSMISLSVQPPTLLVSIDIVSRLADLVIKSGGFSVSMLAAGQEKIADAFAGKMEQGHRFSQGDWAAWPSGRPYLSGTVASFDCELVGAMETGTHVLFAGAVVDIFNAPERESLVWHNRSYKTLAGI
jgi:flavin reductase (DIM6/NTAB) family NADH-FMN oxidoreductase RutF